MTKGKKTTENETSLGQKTFQVAAGDSICNEAICNEYFY